MGFSGRVLPLAVPGEQTGQGRKLVMVVGLGGRGGDSLETWERLMYV